MSDQVKWHVSCLFFHAFYQIYLPRTVGGNSFMAVDDLSIKMRAGEVTVRLPCPGHVLAVVVVRCQNDIHVMCGNLGLF